MIETTPCSVFAPIVGGSGVAVLHRTLAANLPGYRVRELPPEAGLFPPLGALLRHPHEGIVHSTPDLGPWIVPTGSPLVTTFHNFYLDREFRATATTAQRLFYRTILHRSVLGSIRRASEITAVSEFTANLARRELGLPRRPHVIYNGVDTHRFKPLEAAADRRVRILFAGNPIRRKGVEHLVALASQLPNDCELAYTSALRDSAIGAAPEHPRLIRLPKRPHHEMHHLYQTSDILFFPTRREGFGLVAAEAMSSGLPVVATNCSALPELVVHGLGGFLFPPGDRAAMLTYLLRLIRDSGLRTSMGQFNRARAMERFTMQEMTSRYRTLFDSISHR